MTLLGGRRETMVTLENGLYSGRCFPFHEKNIILPELLSYSMNNQTGYFLVVVLGAVNLWKRGLNPV